MEQEVRYVRSGDGTNIAYSDVGEGVPLVISSNIWAHLDLTWNGRSREGLTQLLRDGFRLVRYDMRGDNNRVRKVGIGSGTITTLAGTGVAAYNGDGFVAIAAALDHPEYVAMNASRDVFIADTHNNLIRFVSKATGLILTAAGTGFTGTGDPDAVNALLAHLDHPSGVAVDSLTIADTGNQIIRTVPTNTDPTGQPAAPKPGSGNFCSEGPHGQPLAHAADWSVIAMTMGLIAVRRRVRLLFQLLSSRVHPERRVNAT